MVSRKMYCSSVFLGALCFSWCLTAGSSQAEGRCSKDGDIRLGDGPNATSSEGRVEICFGNQWGTICADNWDNRDASVVCRQLGFTDGLQAPTYPREPGFTHLEDEVSCEGNEQRLSDCLFNRISECTTRQDAGVRCQISNFPRNVEIHTTDSSVVITWQPPGAILPDHYNITLAYTRNLRFSNQTHTSAIQVLGSDTMLELERLVPQQNYSYCISSIHGSNLSTICHNFQTEMLSSGSNKSAVVIGILSSITALLVLFLVLVVIGGLAYPRCIRTRIKNKKCFSRVSDFLDSKIYCSSNSAYSGAPQPMGNPAYAAATMAKTCHQEDLSDPTTSYEAVDDPPPVPDYSVMVYYEAVNKN